MTYEQWMAAVDAILLRKLGVSTSDLADFCSRDAYEDELSPEEGALEALEHDGTGGMDLFLE